MERFVWVIMSYSIVTLMWIALRGALERHEGP